MKEIDDINESFTGKSCRRRKLFFLLSSLGQKLRREALLAEQCQRRRHIMGYYSMTCVCVCVCVCEYSGFQSCPTLCDLMDWSSPGSSCPWNFSGKNAGAICRFLLQGIFPPQGSNLHLLHRSGRFFTTSATWEVPLKWDDAIKPTKSSFHNLSPDLLISSVSMSMICVCFSFDGQALESDQLTTGVEGLVTFSSIQSMILKENV